MYSRKLGSPIIESRKITLSLFIRLGLKCNDIDGSARKLSIFIRAFNKNPQFVRRKYEIPGELTLGGLILKISREIILESNPARASFLAEAIALAFPTPQQEGISNKRFFDIANIFSEIRKEASACRDADGEGGTKTMYRIVLSLADEGFSLFEIGQILGRQTANAEDIANALSGIKMLQNFQGFYIISLVSQRCCQ